MILFPDVVRCSIHSLPPLSLIYLDDDGSTVPAITCRLSDAGEQVPAAIGLLPSKERKVPSLFVPDDTAQVLHIRTPWRIELPVAPAAVSFDSTIAQPCAGVLIAEKDKTFVVAWDAVRRQPGPIFMDTKTGNTFQRIGHRHIFVAGWTVYLCMAADGAPQPADRIFATWSALPETP